VTGAGDTVSAALGCGIAAGLALRDATALANLAAGVVVGKLGTATASLDELRAAMDAHAPAAHGLLVWCVLAACQRARAAGERIAVLLGPSASPTRPCWPASAGRPGGRAAAGDRTRHHRRRQRCGARRPAPGGLGGPGRPDTCATLLLQCAPTPCCARPPPPACRPASSRPC
jgi:hypothetical protein